MKDLGAKELKLIEDMFAVGLTMEDFAVQFGLTLPQARQLFSDNIEVRKARKVGEERFAMVDADARRREALRRKENWFIPTNDDLQVIEGLAKLCWSEVNIAHSFDVELPTWRQAKAKYPKIQEALDRGHAQSNGKSVKSIAQEWRPTPEHLEKIEQLAAKGYTLDGIACEIGLHSNTLSDKINTIPEINEAYERGLAKITGQMINKLVEQANQGNIAAIIYFLKARNKSYWSDAAPKQTEISKEGPSSTIVHLPPPDDGKQFERESEKFKRAHKKK